MSESARERAARLNTGSARIRYEYRDLLKEVNRAAAQEKEKDLEAIKRDAIKMLRPEIDKVRESLINDGKNASARILSEGEPKIVDNGNGTYDVSCEIAYLNPSGGVNTKTVKSRYKATFSSDKIGMRHVTADVARNKNGEHAKTTITASKAGKTLYMDRQNFYKRNGVRHSAIDNECYLVHYGIKGQKWGDRRFQNEDGTLTEEGKRRYSTGGDRYGRDLDDKQLNDRVARLQKEQQYKALNDSIYRKEEVRAEKEAEEKEKRKKEIQKKFVDKALDVGSSIMGELLQNTIKYGMNVAGGEIDNSAENFTKYLFTGKGPSNKSDNGKKDNNKSDNGKKDNNKSDNGKKDNNKAAESNIAKKLSGADFDGDTYKDIKSVINKGNTTITDILNEYGYGALRYLS